uniref:Uncharacterized protein n=1 Tax=Oryza barthii TaxID=65489 RepID=A0A0D3FTZ5_9ORYZ
MCSMLPIVSTSAKNSFFPCLAPSRRFTATLSSPIFPSKTDPNPPSPSFLLKSSVHSLNFSKENRVGIPGNISKSNSSSSSWVRSRGSNLYLEVSGRVVMNSFRLY